MIERTRYVFWSLLLSLLAAVGAAYIVFAPAEQPGGAMVDGKSPSVPVGIFRDLLDQDAGESLSVGGGDAEPLEVLGLERPIGPVRADIVAGAQVRPLGPPLGDRIDEDLRRAFEGDSGLAASVALDLLACEQYMRSVSKADAAALAAQAMGVAESVIEAREDAVLASIEAGVLPELCRGVTSRHVGEIDKLLEHAADAGELSALGPFIDRAISQESLIRFMADPAAKARFEDRARRALDAGIRQCHANSISTSAQLHDLGIIVSRDPSRAFAFELLLAWIWGIEPTSSPIIGAHIGGLSSSQRNSGIRFAQRLYGAYCQ